MDGFGRTDGRNDGGRKGGKKVREGGGRRREAGRAIGRYV